MAASALLFAALARPGLSLDRYENHLKKLSDDTGARYRALLDGGAKDDARTRLAALKHIIVDQEGYDGDTKSYDDIDNADLTRVIDRRKGMPIALAILYIETGRAQGWDLEGINFPGHFIVRIDVGADRVLFDPFGQCRILEAQDLRWLAKKAMGPQAELLTHYYQEAGNREIIIRLENNIKHRMIEAEDYPAALEIVERCRIFAPDEYRLLLDAGVLYAKVGETEKAIAALQGYLAVVTDYRDREDALVFLRHLEQGVD